MGVFDMWRQLIVHKLLFSFDWLVNSVNLLLLVKLSRGKGKPTRHPPLMLPPYSVPTN